MVRSLKERYIWLDITRGLAILWVFLVHFYERFGHGSMFANPGVKIQQDMMHDNRFGEIPVGYEMQVRARSGLAAKHGLTLLNTPGTIDADYRGEIKLISSKLDVKES